ncbi:MAG: dihydroorotate dehydrogenase [Kiritimatiellia bacterium]
MINPPPSGGLAVNLAGIAMKNPVMSASGTFGYGQEFARILDLNLMGAIVVKGISPRPASGNSTPRMVETPAGLINAIGLQNPGCDTFIAEYLPFLRQFQTPTIVNIWGTTLADYAEIAGRFEGVPGVHGLELNISCPNIKAGGMAFGIQPDMARQAIKAARRATRLPLIVKLPPHLFSIAEFARLAEDNGADALSITNSLPAMAVDIEQRRPILANITGGLTGPAIHPVALKLVWDAAKAVKIPIIGMGGIVSAREALAFILAGATAVAVGTASFTDPLTIPKVIDGLAQYLQSHHIDNITELRGALRGLET